MLPLIEQVGAAIDCYVAAQPVPYRTTEQSPTFQSHPLASGRRAFPVGLESFLLDRFEVAVMT